MLEGALGRIGEGLADMRRGIDLWQQTSRRLHLTQYMSELVSCLLHYNQEAYPVDSGAYHIEWPRKDSFACLAPHMGVT